MKTTLRKMLVMLACLSLFLSLIPAALAAESGDGAATLNEQELFGDFMKEKGGRRVNTAFRAGEAVRGAVTGTWGSLSWTLNSDGLLSILGTGAMDNFPENSTAAWKSRAGSIRSVSIARGVTSIGSRAFQGCGSLTVLSIPDTVTSIGAFAAADCGDLRSAALPDSVRSIETGAFSNCAALTDMAIPEGVTTIARGVFNQCGSLRNVSLPSSLTSVDIMAFYACTALESVVIPAGVELLNAYAFANCGALSALTLPASLATVAQGAFSDCAGLARVYYGGISAQWNNISFGIYNEPLLSAHILFQNGRFPSGVLWEVENTGTLTVYGEGEMPDFPGSGAGEWSQYADYITKLVILGGVTRIGSNAFYGLAALTDVTIANTVTDIGGSAFVGCSALTNLSIPTGVQRIGDAAFAGCSNLKTATLPSSVNSLGSGAFFNCVSLRSMTIPVGMTSIRTGTFANCSSLSSLQVPETVTEIEEGAFYGCACLASAGPIGSGSRYQFGWKEAIPANAFSLCTALTSVTIPTGVKTIGSGAFTGCGSLLNLVLATSVTDIGSGAFKNCAKLVSVTIPASVKSIGSFAFDGCAALRDVYYGGTRKLWEKISIGSGNERLSQATLHCEGFVGNWTVSFDANGSSAVAAQTVEEGKKAVKPEDPAKAGFWFCGWYADTALGTLFDFDSAITADTTLYAKWAAPDLVLPTGLTEIGEEAFSGGAFSFVKLPEGVETIGPRAFAGCDALAYIYIPAGASIDGAAFEGVNGLTVFGKAESGAQTFAKEKGFRFTAVR